MSRSRDGAGGRGHQADQVDPAAPNRRLQLGITAGRKVRQQQAGHLQGLGVPDELIQAVLQDRIQIAEDHHWRAQPGLRNHLEGAGQRHAVAECLEAGALDGRAVGERIAEGNPDLDDVGDFANGANGGRTDLRRGVARGEIGYECRSPGGSKRGPSRREPGLRQSSRQASIRIDQGW